MRTPGRPTVYVPDRNGGVVMLNNGNPLMAAQWLVGVLPFVTPQRRRPLLAVLDLLQRRYDLQNSDIPHLGILRPSVNKYDISQNPVESPTSTSLPVISEDVKQTQVKSDKRNKSQTYDSQKEDSEGTDNDLEQKQLKKSAQVSRVYSLLDTILKDHPDTNDGFSYAFKYRIPQIPSKLDGIEASVQQSIDRFPQLPDPLQHRVFKTPIDYRKAQEKLDKILEESTKSGGPIHLNTPGAFGPLLLNQYLEAHPEDKKKLDTVVVEADEGNSQKPTKLMLRPVAKAVAGPKGIAVASPVAKAVLRKGQPVTLEFEPDAVAIAGPGGRAHAHPEFSIDYIESKEAAN